METSCSKFWLGLGLGSIIGVVAYRFSCSSKGKMLKEKACHVLHRMGGKAEDMIDSAKDKVAEAGTKWPTRSPRKLLTSQKKPMM